MRHSTTDQVLGNIILYGEKYVIRGRKDGDEIKIVCHRKVAGQEISPSSYQEGTNSLRFRIR